MKIVVLVGSPKGDRSITKHYVLYLQKKFPNHQYIFFNIAQRIKKIEKSEETFQEIINEIKSSDAIVWAFPLYYLMVHANYKRFIELIYERKAEGAFRGKYALAISTSIHFYDHTAHNYIHGICDDLEMNYFGRYSAGMNDIMKNEKREKFLNYATLFFDSVEKKIPSSKCYPKIIHSNFEYLPELPGESKIKEKIELGGKRVLIVSDVEKGSNNSSNLQKMIGKFKESFSDEIEEVNLRELNIKGSCLGCLQCGYDNQCSYIDKDDYIKFYDSKVKKADILIYAGAIKDRYLSSRWKMFFDRSFYNTHIPVMKGKQIGFIISGHLSQIPNLREILMGWNETNQSNTVDFVTDESQNSEEIDSLLHAFALKSINFSEISFVNEITMRGVAGRKIFRDEIWSSLRFPFRADYKFYKNHGFFDFPYKKRKSIFISKLMLFLSRSKGFRKEVNKRMIPSMITPIKKIIDEK